MRHLSRFRRLVSIVVFGLVAAVFSTPAVSLAQTNDYGLGATAQAAELPNTDKTVQEIIGNVIGTALSLISVLFFALMLYAGLKWMLARGDSDEAKKALDTIVAAIIGMIIVLGSYAITSFVFDNLGGGAGTTGAAGGSGPTTAADNTGYNSQNCATHYPGLQCITKSNCADDQDAKDKVKAAYSGSGGYGILGSTGNYIANSCPGSGDIVCCIKK